MRLIRLQLANWRGVAAREIPFNSGVTLIEGPNEIGKSTLVEALRMLFEELDSSNKRTVKAIQPVGQDVGSRVELEFTSGDYHLRYAKTFNKGKKTELQILAPRAEQLTGREAHDRVQAILEQTMDMALWHALLVEQGKEIAGTRLIDSRGLARALDEAAGGSADATDDGGLMASVQAEYEQYFTLKSGKPKKAVSDLADQLEARRVEVESAREELRAVEADSDSLQRCSREIERQQRGLPGLAQKVEAHQEQWQQISTLQRQVDDKAKALTGARQLLTSAGGEQQGRASLVVEVDAGAAQRAEKREALAPLATRAAQCRDAKAAAEAALRQAKAALQAARATHETALGDQRYWQQHGRLAAARQRAQSLAECNQQAAAARAALGAIGIDAAGLQQVREAEQALQLAISRRDAVVSSLQIEAEQALEVRLNDEALALDAGEVEQRRFGTELRLEFPGLARLRIKPSQSAADLEADVEALRQRLTGLLQRFGVDDLPGAVAAEARRIEAQGELKRWRDQVQALLGSDTEAELLASVDTLQGSCDAYLHGRPAEPELPASMQEADARLEQTQAQLRAAEQAVDSRQGEHDRAVEAHNQADADHRIQQTELQGLERVLGDRQRKLAEARTAEPDEGLQSRLAEADERVSALQSEHSALTQQIQQCAPDIVAQQLQNARDVHDRAGRELQQQRTQRAVLEDRLAKAQANGRYEALQRAEHELEELAHRHQATRARAEAARLLWETLNRHRDATRNAYVRPLKNSIENLGRVVFGEGFAVAVAEDWTLESRTLDGSTIPFGDLSVGSREQLGILTRLAAARIVASQGGVPLIIDDALGFSDPSRLETMGAAIASAGRECQVILLSCSPGRYTHVGNAELVTLA